MHNNIIGIPLKKSWNTKKVRGQKVRREKVLTLKIRTIIFSADIYRG